MSLTMPNEMTFQHLARILLTVLLLGISLLPPPAFARPGNPERHPVGVRAIGRGGAGVAVEANPWFNPAGLGRVKESAISAGVNAYGASRESSDEFAIGPLSGTIESSSVDVFPSSITYLFPAGAYGDWSIGVGATIVVPDWDQFDGNFRIPANNTTFELQALRFRETQTYWSVPAVGGCNEDGWCLGLGLPIALHRQRNNTVVTVSSVRTDGFFFASTITENDEVFALSGALSAGLQVPLSARYRFGASLRTPTTGLSSSGNILHTDSFFTDIPGEASFANRIEIDDPQSEFKQPWRLSVGLAYEEPEVFAWYLDLRVTASQDDYFSYTGPNGETSLPPTGVGGITVLAPEQRIAFAPTVATNATVNANAGIEFFLSPTQVLQVGAFTDFSATPSES
ncbi:MAG: hypothetical protein AAF658_14190, partial [Myxococcota bacterium]